MNKEDFLNELQECLSEGEVSNQEIYDSLAYYRGYIQDEIASGKTQEEVLKELGSPRLIARSIIDASSEEEKQKGSFFEKEEVTYQDDDQQVYQDDKKNKFEVIIKRIITLVVIILAVAAIGTIITGLIPVIVTCLVIYFILRLINDR